MGQHPRIPRAQKRQKRGVRLGGGTPKIGAQVVGKGWHGKSEYKKTAGMAPAVWKNKAVYWKLNVPSAGVILTVVRPNSRIRLKPCEKRPVVSLATTAVVTAPRKLPDGAL